MAKPYAESDTLKVSLSFTRDLALEMQQFRKRQRLTWHEFMDLALDLTAHLTDDQIRDWRLARYTDNAPHKPIGRQLTQTPEKPGESEAIEAAPAAVSPAPPQMEHPADPPLTHSEHNSPTPSGAPRPAVIFLTQTAAGALQPVDGQPFEIGQQYYFSGPDAEILYECEADEDGDPLLREVISLPTRKAPAA